LNIFHAEKSVGGHVEKSIYKLRHISMESNFVWHLAIEHFSK